MMLWRKIVENVLTEGVDVVIVKRGVLCEYSHIALLRY